MSEQPVAEVQPQDPATPETGQPANAAPWADYVKDLPASVVPLVEPIFKKWDGDVTQRFQTVHSDYEPLKPFRQIVDNGWDFNDVQQALVLAQQLNENPQAVYNALQEAYGYGAEQGQSDDENVGFSDPEYVDPNLQRYMEMTETMAQLLTQQQQSEQQAREDAELDQTLTALAEKHGQFDPEYVMTKVYAGNTWEQAIEAYQGLINNVAANRPAAPPVIMGSGGGLPSQVVNPASMSDKDRKALITQMLAQAAQQ